jgi:hypothetical protein
MVKILRRDGKSDRFPPTTFGCLSQLTLTVLLVFGSASAFAPENAIVLSCDEKSQMQALDRTQPGLPMNKGRCGTMTHDYKRNGTTTLFAALNTHDGSILQTCMPQHRHQEWIRFLNLIKRNTPSDKEIHIICDNYAARAAGSPPRLGVAGLPFRFSLAGPLLDFVWVKIDTK